MIKGRKRLFVLFISMIMGMQLCLTGCSKDDGGNVNPENKKAVEQAKAYNESGKKPLATIVIKDFGTIKVELYPECAPQTVYSFISLANSGFYNGLTIHRIAKNFVVQGGDPDGNGRGGPGYSIKGEFAINGFEFNSIKHEKGVISMARSNDYDSAGSQFFLVLETSSGVTKSLDLKYAAFGRTVEGLEVLDSLNKVEVTDETPKEKVIIESISVDTFGDTYPEPNKLNAER